MLMLVKVKTFERESKVDEFVPELALVLTWKLNVIQQENEKEHEKRE